MRDVMRTRRTRRAGWGRVRGRGRERPRPPRNHGPVAGRAPMTAMLVLLPGVLGRCRAASLRDGEAGRRLEVEAFLDLDGGDLVAEPMGFLARGVRSPL